MDMRPVVSGPSAAADLHPDPHADLADRDRLAREVASRIAAATAAARTIAEARAALTEAQIRAEPFAADHGVRLALLVLRERANDSHGLLAAWEEIFAVTPDDEVVQRHYLQRLVRQGDEARALAILDGIAPLDQLDRTQLVVRAEFLDTIRAHGPSDQVYTRLLDRFDRPSTRLSWAKRLARRGLYEDAGRLLADPEVAATAREKMPDVADDIARQREFFRRFYAPDDMAGVDFTILAMEQAILHYRQRPLPPAGDRQRIALVTGNLGPGGAERQLSRLAVQIHAATTAPATGSDSGFGSVEVIVKDHATADRRNFFLPDLLDAGIDVFQLNAATPIPARRQAICHADLRHLLGMLPPQVHYGVVRLAPHLRQQQIDVASLWQDGACLFGALAALFAGVPRIHLVFRGLPPNIRVHRARPEYERLYKALAQVPGVSFASNSKAAAVAYAQWLDLPVERFTILYNCVPCPRSEPFAEDVASWARFAAATAGASETIGGIFRFVSDKNPLTWVRMAAAYRQRHPAARFVIVGSGRLQDDARALADKLGLGDRLLFVGASKAVGFWFAKMDVAVLLSRFEGLPNVLIEAQHLGRPVVSTPAGGATECFDEGVTGHCLDDALAPDLDLACRRIRDLVDRARAAPDQLADAARAVAGRFAGSALLDRFSALCHR